MVMVRVMMMAVVVVAVIMLVMVSGMIALAPEMVEAVVTRW